MVLTTQGLVVGLSSYWVFCLSAFMQFILSSVRFTVAVKGATDLAFILKHSKQLN